MGQYYRGVILGKTSKKRNKFIVRKAFCCYVHGNGAKLMEHSYVGNYYVKEYEHSLANEFDGYPFVWVGDYADAKFGEDDGFTKAHEYIDTLVHRAAIKRGYRPNKNREGEYFNDYETIYSNDKRLQDLTPYDELPTYKYIINYTKKQFVRIPKETRELTIHPLPLLCADGNGRGGGDYSGTNMKAIGIWAYDRIGVSNEIPKHIKTELVVTFKECYDGGDESVNDFSYQKIK